jgi:hypothetical protein
MDKLGIAGKAKHLALPKTLQGGEPGD